MTRAIAAVAAGLLIALGAVAAVLDQPAPSVPPAVAAAAQAVPAAAAAPAGALAPAGVAPAPADAGPAPADAATVPAPGAAPQPTTPAAVARPVRLVIPAIGVDSSVVDIGRDGSGALVPPESAAIVGWFAAGPAPGATGPALLAGHVDSRAGPGVFYRLRDLRPGDRVEVVESDGSVAAFTVTSRVEAPKTAFPTDLVYAPTPGPELRLVTCGGAFNRSVRSYLDNVIVEAVPVDGGQWRLS